MLTVASAPYSLNTGLNGTGQVRTVHSDIVIFCRTDGQTDRQVDGRYQVHYILPNRRTNGQTSGCTLPSALSPSFTVLGSR